MMVTMKTIVLLLVVTPCSVVELYRCCGGSCHIEDKDVYKGRPPKRHTLWDLGVEKCKVIFGTYIPSCLLLS
jgi:hypothetical protein